MNTLLTILKWSAGAGIIVVVAIGMSWLISASDADDAHDDNMRALHETSLEDGLPPVKSGENASRRSGPKVMP